MRGRLRPSS